ncbi:MAG TPA: CARDB domain-containing protein [Thermoanaerobaculia bacterium]|nr:CARDB domain-containing protein [Thermoanaerobaculia bacterium]
MLSGTLGVLALLAGALPLLAAPPAADAAIGGRASAAIAFPDTAVGATSTHPCASFCFVQFFSPPSACDGSGEVTLVHDVAAPFAAYNYRKGLAGQPCGGTPVTLPTSLNAGEKLWLDLAFSPTRPGSFTDSLVLTDSSFDLSGATPQSALPNLIPYQPRGWSGAIVVSKDPNSEVDSPTLLATDTLYLSWAATNASATPTASSFFIDVLLDGNFLSRWQAAAGLAAGHYISVDAFKFGPLPAGQHTLTIYLDSTNSVAESDENDNQFSKTWIIQPASPTIHLVGPAAGTALAALAFTATASGCTANPLGWSWTSDVDLLRFDGGLEPGVGSFPVASQTASTDVGWATPAAHTLHAFNTGCPGADGQKTVQIQPPADQTTHLYSAGGRSVDRGLPTMVFCHGLETSGFDPKDQWSCVGPCSSKVEHPLSDLLAAVGHAGDLNEFQFFWSGAGHGATSVFAVDYLEAWEYVEEAGRKLAEELTQVLGNDYKQPIQFVGHSLGSIVCARGAATFLESEPGVTKAQLTVLDRPDHVHKLLHDSPFPNFEARFGFDATRLPALLAGAMRDGLDFRLDNYWSSSIAGVGDATNCFAGAQVYNHPKPAGLRRPLNIGDRYFPDEAFAGFISNNHVGVEQWYRWTFTPNAIAAASHDPAVCAGTTFTSPPDPSGVPLFDASLSPCDAGWRASIFGPAPDPFPADAACGPADVSREPVAVCLGVGGTCQAQAGPVLAVEARASASASTERVSQVAVDLPAYARNLFFHLAATNAGAASSAVVQLDAVPLWSGSLASFPAQGPVEIGPLSLYGLTGRHELTLKVLGPATSVVRVTDLEVQKILVPCAAGDTLCIAAHRFRVEADWTDHAGNSGRATPRYVDSDASGFLWFFDASNLELIVKVLNACPLPTNRRFWVFAAGLTDVEVRLTVTDTATGAVKVYTSPSGTPFEPIQDTDAFATCTPSDSLVAAERSTAAPRDQTPAVATRGLDQGRFDVTAFWRTQDGTTGSGQFVPVTDNSGYFWFFDPGNIEMTVKILDACGLNDRFWVFAAGLTNVEVALTVTDTRTGTQATYHNNLGQSFRPIQDTGAFATCP